MGRTKPTHKTAGTRPPAAGWAISEDWLATGIGIALILLIRLADITIKWPLFEWFKK